MCKSRWSKKDKSCKRSLWTPPQSRAKSLHWYHHMRFEQEWRSWNLDLKSQMTMIHHSIIKNNFTCVCLILLSHWYHHMTFGQGQKSQNSIQNPCCSFKQTNRHKKINTCKHSWKFWKKVSNDNSLPLNNVTCVCLILLSHWYHHMTFGQGRRSRNLDVKLRIHGGCIYVGWRTSSIVSRPKMKKVGRLKKRNYIVALTGCS